MEMKKEATLKQRSSSTSISISGEENRRLDKNKRRAAEGEEEEEPKRVKQRNGPESNSIKPSSSGQSRPPTRFHCLLCSGLLVRYGEEGSGDGGFTESEWLFCARCKVPWLSGFLLSIKASSSGQSRPTRPDTYCGICMDPKFRHECFPVNNCSHRYCASCVCRYVEAKIGENVTSVRCPDLGCRTGALDPEHCRPILSPEVYDRWGRALCDAMFVGSARFYCPFKDCSGLLVRDGEQGGGGEVRESECPYCHRLFCARCKVPWHSGVRCEDRTKLAAEKQEESMMREMAKRSKWARCPNCKFYVSRTGGCEEIVCRCKYRFCYICGSEWSPSHYNCKRVEKNI